MVASISAFVIPGRTTLSGAWSRNRGQNRSGKENWGITATIAGKTFRCVIADAHVQRFYVPGIRLTPLDPVWTLPARSRYHGRLEVQGTAVGS